MINSATAFSRRLLPGRHRPIRFAACERRQYLSHFFARRVPPPTGDPDTTYGVGRYLQVLLRARYPGIDFEVISVAMTAIDSGTILPIARECARHQGDLWLI